MILDRKLEGDPDRLARVRRLSRRAMAVLEHGRTWSNPLGEVAVQAAVVRGVETLLLSGETDETVILEQVLQTVCGGRLTAVLRAKLAPGAADLDTCLPNHSPGSYRGPVTVKQWEPETRRPMAGRGEPERSSS